MKITFSPDAQGDGAITAFLSPHLGTTFTAKTPIGSKYVGVLVAVDDFSLTLKLSERPLHLRPSVERMTIPYDYVDTLEYS